MFLSENFYINGIRNSQLNLYLVKFDKEVLSEVGSVYVKGVEVDTTNEYNPLVSLSSDDTNEVTLNFALLDSSFTPIPWTETMVNEIINIFTENPINEFISDDFPDNIFYMTTTKIVKKFTYAKLGVLEITFKLASMYSYVRKTYDCTCVNTSNLKIENIGVNRYKPTIQVTNNGNESTVNKIGDIEITGLTNGESIIIDNQMLLVYYDGVNKYDKTNGKWLTLEKGRNIINVSGNCEIKIYCEFPQLV